MELGKAELLLHGSGWQSEVTKVMQGHSGRAGGWHGWALHPCDPPPSISFLPSQAHCGDRHLREPRAHQGGGHGFLHLHEQEGEADRQGRGWHPPPGDGGVPGLDFDFGGRGRGTLQPRRVGRGGQVPCGAHSLNLPEQIGGLLGYSPRLHGTRAGNVEMLCGAGCLVMLPSSHCAPSLGQRGLDGGNPHGAAILWEDFPSPGAVGPLPGPGAVCNVEELGLQLPLAPVGIVPMDHVLSSLVAPPVLGGMGWVDENCCRDGEFAHGRAGRGNIPCCAQGVEAWDTLHMGAHSPVLTLPWK